MLVSEMKTLPKKAGTAKLEFLPSEEMPMRGVLAARQEDRILLLREGSRFYPLKAGEQFLFTVGSGTRRLYFGGMDESPFLVELDMTAFENVLDGEDAFFEGLKPVWVRRMERETRRAARRQGDFFAFAPTNDMASFLREYLSPGLTAEINVVEKMSLDGTRHRLTGLHFVLKDRSNRSTRGGEGLIEAPDHEPLKLEGPHIILQALHLTKPQEAD